MFNTRVSTLKVKIAQETVVTLVLLLIISVAAWLGWDAPLRSSIQVVSQPLQVRTAQMFYTMMFPVRAIGTRYATAGRVEELEEELNKATARLGVLERVESENEQLRQKLGAQSRPKQTIIGSPIISYGLPTISVGMAHGVTVGTPVTAAGVMIGIVDTVSEQQSTVSLLFQQQVQPLVVRTSSGSEGLIVGDGKRVLLTEVPHDQVLHEGDTVVTLGQEHIAADLFVGTIQDVISEESAPVQTAVVEQTTSFYEVTIIEVLP